MKTELSPCPNKPNCVCSNASPENKPAYMTPLKLDTDPMPEILQLVRTLKWTVNEHSENYIHAIAQSGLFKFKDDIEFLYLKDQKTLHFRSASRSGYWDMGVNRKRMVDFFKKLNIHA
jgi:uncharacterized protein (DUF1499 family)